MEMYSKQLIIFLSVISLITSISVPCSQPFLQLTSKCESTSIKVFNLEAVKKINCKKPLNGAMKIVLGQSNRNDATRLGKCIDLSINEEKIEEIKVNFKNNQVIGKSIIKYTNGTMIEVHLDGQHVHVQLQKNYQVTDFPTFHQVKKQLIKVSHCQFETKWTLFGNLPYLVYSQKFQGYSLFTEDFTKFNLCKGFSETLRIQCSTIEKSLLSEKDGFWSIPEDFKLENLNFGHFAKKNDQIEQISGQKLLVDSQSIQLLTDWVQWITSEEVMPYFYEKVSNHLISSDIEQFEMEIDTSEMKLPPNMVYQKAEIEQNGNVIFEATDLNTDSHTFFRKLDSAFFQPHLPSWIKVVAHYPNATMAQIIDKKHQITFRISSYICQDGKLCGLVKKYGRMLRDTTICHEIEQEPLSLIALFDEDGNQQGPTFNFLIGDSLIYNPSGHFPTTSAAYLYYGAPFALLGSFDQTKQMVEAHKVNYSINGCTKDLLPIFEFAQPTNPNVVYHYSPPNRTSFGDQPTLNDELGEDYLDIKIADDTKGEGLFAKKDIPVNTLIAQYGGYRTVNKEYMRPEDIDDEHPHSYRHSVGLCRIVVDIPKGFEPKEKYSATYGHKINHNFHDTVNYFYVSTLFWLDYG